MRTFSRNITLPLVMLLTLSACETDVEFRGEYVEPQMVVYSVVTAEEPIKVFVSRSSFVLDDEIHPEVHDAEVEVWVNGTLAERLVEVEEEDPQGTGIQHYYTGETLCHSGDRVEIRVASSGFEGTASGETTIPAEPMLGGLRATITTISEDEVFAEGTLYCPLSDPADQTNYYWLRGMISDIDRPAINWVRYTDVVFGGGAPEGILGEIMGEEYREYVLFDDSLIGGKTDYPLAMEWDHNLSDLDHSLYRVECWQVDENLYKYFLSLELSADGAMFAEPVQVHNNISGGIGLVASRSATATRELLCHETEK